MSEGVSVLGTVIRVELICCDVVVGNKGVIEMGQGVNILHHLGQLVEDHKWYPRSS